MSPRGLRTAPLVLLLVAVFALGSVSTATATGLTKGAVKKIAAKVVKKRAPSLSVAHANTATTASTATEALRLGGLTADQLGVRPIVFRVPAGPHAVDKVFTLKGVPAGTYELSLHGVLNTTPGSSAECDVFNQTQAAFPLAVSSQAPGQFPAVNGVGYGTVNAGDALTFYCSTPAPWSPQYPMHLTFTPVASATAGTMTAARGTAGSASR